MSKVTQEEIIEILKEHGSLYVYEIANLMGVISPRVQSGIHVLKSYGKIEQEGGKYKLIEIKENNKKQISIIIDIDKQNYREAMTKLKELYLLKEWDMRTFSNMEQLWGD